MIYHKIIIDRAEELQEDCHAHVDQMISKNNKVSYQDATNTWIFLKLAEMETLRIFTRNN